MSNQDLDESSLLDAATLAFAMVRFAEGVGYAERGHNPPGTPRVGEDVYSFFPSPRRVPIGDVPVFLAKLPCPAFLIPSTTRGMVSLHLLNELSPDRARVIEHELQNQSLGLAELVAQYGLDPDSEVVLEFGQEVHIFQLRVLQTWATRFAVYVGWNLAPLRGDSRAVARLNLFRADGAQTIGAPGPGVQV